MILIVVFNYSESLYLPNESPKLSDSRVFVGGVDQNVSWIEWVAWIDKILAWVNKFLV